MQGTILILSLFAFFLIADIDAFAAQASAVPGSNEEARAGTLFFWGQRFVLVGRVGLGGR